MTPSRSLGPVAPTRDKTGRWTHTRGKPPGHGRLLRAVRRTFIAHNFQPLTIRTFLPRAYPDARQYVKWMYERLREALRSCAVSLGRQWHLQGAPHLWKWSR
jgi:hypothetical protein